MKTIKTICLALLTMLGVAQFNQVSAQAELRELNIPYLLRDVPAATNKSWDAETTIIFHDIHRADRFESYVSSGINSLLTYKFEGITQYRGTITLTVALRHRGVLQYVGTVTVTDTWTNLQSVRPKLVIKEWSPIGK